MCTHLEKLYFFDNNIRTLPQALGSLSELQMLGVQVNPLDPTLKQMIIDSGTKALILHLRENGPIPEPPARRPMIILSDPDTSEYSFTPRTKILTYNILYDYYATEKQFCYTPSGALSWGYRRETIWVGIETAGADILCLQEIDTESFEGFFYVKAAHLGLNGVINGRTTFLHALDTFFLDALNVITNYCEIGVQEEDERGAWSGPLANRPTP